MALASLAPFNAAPTVVSVEKFIVSVEPTLSDQASPIDDDTAPTVVSVTVVSVETVLEEEIVSVEKVEVENVYSEAKPKPPSPTAPLLGGRMSPVSVCGRSSPVEGGRSSPPSYPAVVADHNSERRPSKTLNTAALGRARSSSSLDRNSSAAQLLSDVNVAAAGMGGSRRLAAGSMERQPVELMSGVLHRQTGAFVRRWWGRD